MSETFKPFLPTEQGLEKKLESKLIEEDKKKTLVDSAEVPEVNLSESVEGVKHKDFDLIAEKLLISRGVTSEKFGSPNIYLAAENLYAALYEPETIDGPIAPNEKFPDRIPMLKKGLSVAPLVVPEKAEFVAKVRHAMVSEVEFGDCFGESARQQFRAVLEKSEMTFIWTNGDAEGVPDQNLPGSKEQLKKLASAQAYNKMRREIAQERGVHHTEVLSVVAIEGKMKFIPAIVEKFTEKEIKRIFIIEDTAKNLIQAMDIIKKIAPDMEIFPVWIRVGQLRNKIDKSKNIDEWVKELHAIDDISQLSSVLEDGNVFEDGVKVGSIFDLDGPLHDDDIRKRLQIQAVIDALQEKGWL